MWSAIRSWADAIGSKARSSMRWLRQWGVGVMVCSVTLMLRLRWEQKLVVMPRCSNSCWMYAGGDRQNISQSPNRPTIATLNWWWSCIATAWENLCMMDRAKHAPLGDKSGNSACPCMLCHGTVLFGDAKLEETTGEINLHWQVSWAGRAYSWWQVHVEPCGAYGYSNQKVTECMGVEVLFKESLLKQEMKLLMY